jgi:hypothetical protein
LKNKIRILNNNIVSCAIRSVWSLILRGECRLRVFENRILRRIVGPKSDDNGEWRRRHNEELHSLYRSPKTVREIKPRGLRSSGYVTRMEEARSDLKILTGKLTGKRPSGRPKYRWEENVRMNLKDTGANTRK